MLSWRVEAEVELERRCGPTAMIHCADLFAVRTIKR
jgi:hypothetical protein